MPAVTVADIPAICAEIAAGKTLSEIARNHGFIRESVYWLANENPDVASCIARARDAGADAIAEDAMRIADTPQRGEIRTIKPDGTEEVRYEDMLGHRKLQVDTRLRLLAKWAPKKYGERMEQVHTGTITHAVISEERRLELIERRRALRAGERPAKVVEVEGEKKD